MTFGYIPARKVYTGVREWSGLGKSAVIFLWHFSLLAGWHEALLMGTEEAF